MATELTERIREYLIPQMDEYIFDELAEDYLKRMELYDILYEVPVPIKKTELTELTNLKIAHNMAVVIGADINFKYKDNYIKYIEKTFGPDFNKIIIAEGVDKAAEGYYLDAISLFRAVIQMEPDSKDAIYCYGRACRDAYGEGESEDREGQERTGRFKAESLEAFEKLIRIAPDFPMGYYFLAYSYLNLGLYIKADLAFRRFMELTEGELLETTIEGQNVSDMRREVSEWQRKLEDPIKIEGGYNSVLGGRYGEGIATLTPFSLDDRFNKWWPLWYYLGIANRALDEFEIAIENHLEVLKLAPSNQDSMKELAELYEIMGDREASEKYRQKIEIVKNN